MSETLALSSGAIEDTLMEADPTRVPPNFSTIKPRVNAIQSEPIAGVVKFAKFTQFAIV
jgi:hypothetical protein